MKKYNLIFLVVLLFPICVYAQPNSDDLNKAILKTQSKIEIGITYHEYRIEVQNINFEFNRYQIAFDKWGKDDSIETTIMENELTKFLDYMLILQNYKIALSLWQYQHAAEDKWIREDLAFLDILRERLGEKFNDFKIEEHTKEKGRQKYVKTDIIMQMFWQSSINEIKKYVEG